MKKLALLDVTTSDYFKGYHLPTIAIPMSDYMTYSDVADGIKDEIDAYYDYFFNEDGFDKEDEELVNQLINECKSKGDEIFYCTQKCNETMQKDADDYFDSDRFEYAYFSIVDMKTINGITFLS